MPTYDSWEGLCYAAQKKCLRILEKDVAPVATKILKQHIQTDIYDAYKPGHKQWVNATTYERRHVLENSLYTLYTGPNEITITSNANANESIIAGWNFTISEPGGFLKFFEQNNFGIWRKGFPRPAVSRAQKEINNSMEIKQAIATGVEREFNT